MSNDDYDRLVQAWVREWGCQRTWPDFDDSRYQRCVREHARQQHEAITAYEQELG